MLSTFSQTLFANGILNAIDSLFIFGSTSTSIALNRIELGLIVVPTTAGVFCAVGIGTNLESKFLLEEKNYYPEKYTLSNKTVHGFRKMYKKLGG